MKIFHFLKFKKPGINLFILIIILVFGLVLRIYQIYNIPSGFFCDEASIGYNAYSILSTGKDEFEKSYPVFFQSFGDFRHPLAIYSTIPFVALFGLNEFSIRFNSIVYGLITIILMYFIGREIHSKAAGLISALITSTMPWLIHYNRSGFEFTIYSAFFTASVFLFIKAGNNKHYIIPAFIVSALTVYTYQSAKLLIPLLLLGVLMIYFKKYFKSKKELLIGIIIFFVLCIPLIISLLNGEGFARFNMVSVFSAKLSISKTVQLIFNNYVTQFSPSYFFHSEPTFITRHFINGLTPLLITTIPFLLIGFIYLILTITKKPSQTLLYWLIIYPLAGTVTSDGPFTSRSIIGAPIFAIIIGLGILTFVTYGKRFIKDYILYSIITTAILLNTVLFANFYFTKYPLYSADYWGWQFGPREIIQFFSQNSTIYDDLFMAPDFNAPEIFLRFYAPRGCDNCKLGTPDSSYEKNRKQIFAVTPDYMKNHSNFKYRPVKTIYYPNGNAAFILTEIEN